MTKKEKKIDFIDNFQLLFIFLFCLDGCKFEYNKSELIELSGGLNSFLHEFFLVDWKKRRTSKFDRKIVEVVGDDV